MVQLGPKGRLGPEARLRAQRKPGTGGRAIMSETKVPDDPAADGKSLSPAARRALDEAAQRRAEIDARAAELARTKEHQGRGGLEPVRYEDWEVKGLASDF
jgi:hypothetical protein